MLACHDIDISYAGRSVLRRVTVEVRRGKVTAIIGPSGAGKSTALRCLAFLEAPAVGSLLLDERTYRFPEARATMPRPWPAVTTVFQQLFLWPHLTLRQNIRLPLELGNVSDADDRIEHLGRQFGMGEFIDRYPNQVSAGQRQRAALARAIALRPSYLLLDEITSALDVEQSAAIFGHLGELARQGIGILLVTHHLGFLQRTADTIVFMQAGVVEETGPKAILSEPTSPSLRRFLGAFDSIESRDAFRGTTNGE
jgi:polar amino acid transport system ATP-binding protein